MNTRTYRARLPALLLSLAGLIASGRAEARSCATDADCGSNARCEIAPLPDTPPCPAGQTCPAPVTPPPSSSGSCVDQPLSCASDADCPAYLKCQATSAPGCATGTAPGDPGSGGAPANGPGGGGPAACPPAPTPTSGQCGYREIKCQADADCPANFGCTRMTGQVCSGTACASGTTCTPTPPSCSGGYLTCAPRAMTCAADADCPTSWSCATVGGLNCATGGDTTPGGVPTPAPGDMGSAGTGAGCTPQPATHQCAPPGLNYNTGGVAASDGTSGGLGSSAPRTPGAAGASGMAASAPAAAPGSSGGGSNGCATSHGPAGRPSLLLAAGLLGLGARLARRRQRRA